MSRGSPPRSGLHHRTRGLPILSRPQSEWRNAVRRRKYIWGYQGICPLCHGVRDAAYKATSGNDRRSATGFATELWAPSSDLSSRFSHTNYTQLPYLRAREAQHRQVKLGPPHQAVPTTSWPGRLGELSFKALTWVFWALNCTRWEDQQQHWAPRDGRMRRQVSAKAAQASFQNNLPVLLSPSPQLAYCLWRGWILHGSI